MQIKDLSMYQLAFWGFDLKAFSSKDPETIELQSEINRDITDSVFNPNISSDGLRERQLTITRVAQFLLFWGTLTIIIIGGPLMLVSSPWYLVAIPFCAGHYLIGAGIYIALVRGCRASLDEIKFKNQGKPIGFKINTKSHVRVYDFLIVLPTALFPLLYLV